MEALSSTWLEKVSLQQAETYSDYVYYELEEEGTVISSGSILFCPPKHFRFRDPELRVEVSGENELMVTAGAYAKSVEILNGEDTMLLEDNYFDMNPGSRKVKILKGDPADLKIRSVYEIR